MNNKLSNHLLFCLIGLGTISVGVFLPPARLLALVMPGVAEAFSDDLVTGLWYFKVALVLIGIVLTSFPLLVKYLWEYSGEREAESKEQWGKSEDRKVGSGERGSGFELRNYAVTRDTKAEIGKQGVLKGKLPSVTSWEKVVLAFIVLLALVLRLVSADQSFNGDEALVQHSFVDRGLPVILTYWPASTHHIGYEIFAWFSERLPFSTEFASRLPAVLFGTLAVWTGYFLTRMFLTPLLSICITFLHAVSLFAIMHSNMLKGYSCVHLCFILSLMGIVKILSRPAETSGWLLLGISLAVMPYMHLHTVFLVVGIVLTFLILWLLTAGSNVSMHVFLLKRSVLVFGLVGLGLLLIYSIPLPQIIKTAQGMSERAELPLSIDFFKGWLIQMTFWGRFWYASIIAIFFAVVGLVRLIKLNFKMAVLFSLPVILVLLFTWLTSGFIYPRYMVFSILVFLILIVIGVDAVASLFSSRLLRGTVLCVAIMTFVVCQFPAMGDYYKYGNQNLRGAVELVKTKVASTDTVVAYGLARKLFVLFDEDIRPVADQQELQNVIDTAAADVYLLYAWRKSWKSREAEFKWIDEHFRTVHKFPGMLMDTTEADGDVVLLVWEQKSVGCGMRDARCGERDAICGAWDVGRGE